MLDSRLLQRAALGMRGTTVTARGVECEARYRPQKRHTQADVEHTVTELTGATVLFNPISAKQNCPVIKFETVHAKERCRSRTCTITIVVRKSAPLTPTPISQRCSHIDR